MLLLGPFHALFCVIKRVRVVVLQGWALFCIKVGAQSSRGCDDVCPGSEGGGGPAKEGR